MSTFINDLKKHNMKEYLLILDKDGFGIYFPTVMAAYETAYKLKLKTFKIVKQ